VLQDDAIVEGDGVFHARSEEHVEAPVGIGREPQMNEWEKRGQGLSQWEAMGE
jgi:hypothetical protein